MNDADGANTTPLETACRAQGVPSGFEQANTQITTFTGGNPDLDPEDSDSYTVGIVHDATWAEGFAERLTFELTYYNHQIDGAIQALDIQALLNACLRRAAARIPSCARHSRASAAATCVRLTTFWRTWARSRPTASTSRSTGAATRCQLARSRPACRPRA